MHFRVPTRIAVGPNCFNFLCKKLLPAKFIAKAFYDRQKGCKNSGPSYIDDVIADTKRYIEIFNNCVCRDIEHAESLESKKEA